MQNNTNSMRPLGPEQTGRPLLRLQPIPDPTGASSPLHSNRPIPSSTPSLDQSIPSSNLLSVELLAVSFQKTIEKNFQSEVFERNLERNIILELKNWVDKKLAELPRSPEDAASQTHLSEHEENSKASSDSQQPFTNEDVAQLLRPLNARNISAQAIDAGAIEEHIKKLAQEIKAEVVAFFASPSYLNSIKEKIRKNIENCPEAPSSPGNPLETKKVGPENFLDTCLSEKDRKSVV